MSLPTTIEEVRCRVILDSRGQPTVEVEVVTVEGFGVASAPSGASKGRFEALAYPVGSVEEALKKVRGNVAPELIGLDSSEQENMDRLLRELDGTENFSNLGGNTAYAISLAVAEAAAASLGLPLFQHLAGCLVSELPYPLGNVLGGGKHAGTGCPDIQEFLVCPLGAESFKAAAEVNVNVHRTLRGLLEDAGVPFFGGKGDEGAWAPAIDNEKALEFVAKAAEKVTEKTGVKVNIGLDVAASSLWDEKKGKYVYRHGQSKDTGEQVDYILDKIKSHRLFYVEDALQEEDFEGFHELTRKAGRCLICGDDLFVTNKARLTRGIGLKAGNAVIIKPNQVGTVTDAYEAVKLARTNGYVPVFSHRSGETVDVHLAHLAIAFQCPLVKLGVLGGERVAKVNEFIRVEEYLKTRAGMAQLNI